MEDTLGGVENGHLWTTYKVLILILMEDTLGVKEAKATETSFEVLILVLMEDTLGEIEEALKEMTTKSLNPCSNGRCSRSGMIKIFVLLIIVLILVLMEDTLGEQKIDLSDNQCITINFLQKPFNFHKK